MRPVLIACILCLLASCSGPKKELLPSGLSADSVIPRDEMIRVMVDVHLVEATLTLQRNKGGDIPVLTESYYQWLCRKHHISDRRFRGNLNYYKTDPENFSKMYNEVLKILSAQVKKTGDPERVKAIPQ
jgi:hypothetical protein